MGTRGRHSSFRTSFVRATGFRYQLWFNSDKPGKGDPWVVWKGGDQVRSQGLSPSSGVANLRFDAALSRMAAFSAGSSVTIPQLLLPDHFRASDLISLIVNPTLAGEEKIDGRRTFRIEGTLRGFPIRLWIDQTRHLILKSYRKVSIGDRLEESTVQYKPKLDVTVSPEDLVFAPSANDAGKDARISRLLPTSTINLLNAPKLRNFGSSLSNNQKKTDAVARASDDEDVVRVETDLVVCPVLVVDAQGKIIRGLTAEDFIVKEDDKVQEVASFSLGDNKAVPRSIVLIIDYSGSQLPYIKTSVESAKMLVDKLNPRDRMAIVTDDVSLLVDFTSDKELLKTQLEGLKNSALSGIIGASDQYDALQATLNELFSREDARPIVIFQTDGDQLEGLKGSTAPSDPYWMPRKYGLDDILTATERTRTIVYSVISGVRYVGVTLEELPKRAKIDWENRQHASYELMRARNYPIPKSSVSPPDQFFERYGDQWLRRQTALANLAMSTGALPEYLEEPGQADEIYTRVLTDIERRYVIGYYPTNRERDGKRRKVSIEVRNHPEYLVWGQRSYFSRKEQ